MTAAERGKRIKEARISKKMTQSEVVGDFITRNMLSQIENGCAAPSVKTLEYLADVLDISVAELMPRSDEESCSEQHSEMNRLKKVKRLLAENRCRDAEAEIGCESGWGELYDEFCALSAICCFRLAESLSEEDTVKAVEYARRAAELAEHGFYTNPSMKADAVKLMNALAEKLSRYYAELIDTEINY